MVDSPKQESQFKACCITLDWYCMIIWDISIQDRFWSQYYFHAHVICEFRGFSDSWKSSHLIPLGLIFDVLQMSLPSLQVLCIWDWQFRSRMWGEPGELDCPIHESQFTVPARVWAGLQLLPVSLPLLLTSCCLVHCSFSKICLSCSKRLCSLTYVSMTWINFISGWCIYLHFQL